MIPELENILEVIKTVIASIKEFFNQLIAIVKGEDKTEEE